jgi:signal transduction histidine kinase
MSDVTPHAYPQVVARFRSLTDWTSIGFPVLALASVVTVLISEPVHGWRLVPTFAMLVPWVLMAGGVRVPPGWFIAAVIVPVAILSAHGIQGSVFVLLFTIVWLGVAGVPRWVPVAVAAVAVGLSAMAGVVSHHGFDKGVLYFPLGAVLTLLCSELMRRERGLVRELGVAREELSERAAEHERTRIAREIHDVVGHSLTVVQLHVIGARRQLALDPARADESLAKAEEIGRDSLDHLRQVVGLLRNGDEGVSGASAPMPRAADVPALVGSAAEAGLDVSLDVDGDLADVEPAVGLCAYRVVQEALANARHHAPGKPVSVRMTVQRCRSLDVVVANPLEPTVRGGDKGVVRQGSGVIGMKERAAACHGDLSVGQRADSWVVKLRLPLAVSRS